MDTEQVAAQHGFREDIPGLPPALAIDAYERHMQSGSTKNIDIAIGLAKQGIYRTANGNPPLIRWLNNLGIFRYKRTREIKDLEAIQTARKAVESIPADHPDRAACLNDFGEQTGEIKDTQSRPPGGIDTSRPHRATWLNNLGDHLESRYKRTGEMNDLEEALRYLMMLGIILTPCPSIMFVPPLVA
jgi:hypothetical protein